MDNIKMGIKDIGWESVAWIDFVQDRDMLWAVVNAVMKLWVP
jgi:hypothetical protein